MNGTVTPVPGGGPLQKNTPTPSDLATAGEVDDWTFNGQSGETVSIDVDPGGGGPLAAPSPQLGWVTVSLINSDGIVQATATNASGGSGSTVTLSDFTFPADGTYTIQVEAPSSQSASTGFYEIALYDETPHVTPLVLGQSQSGTLGGPFGIDEWSFSGSANQVVQLNKINAQPGIVFSLTGPGGYVAFSNLTGDSGTITLPASGAYVLSVNGTGGTSYSYSFELDSLTIDSLTLGTIQDETSSGTGYSQLFSVNVPSVQTLFISVQDGAAGDVNTLYAKLGSPPSLSSFGYVSSGAATPSPQILVSSAAPGTWYFLVYSNSSQPSTNYSIVATSAPVQLDNVGPSYSGQARDVSLTITGAGFSQGMTVELISPGGTTTYPATSVSIDTFNQITAAFDLTKVPITGTNAPYTVKVTRKDGTTAELTAAFTVTTSGSAQLETKLILPDPMGRHVSSIIYIEYANTGSEPMPAPLLVLSCPPKMENGVEVINEPLFTLNPALQVSGFWTAGLPTGYSHTVEILASGSVPGVLEPGESVKVPVYYAGMEQPWYFPDTFYFNLQVYGQYDKTAINWSSLESSLQPSGISTAAWNAIYSGLTSEIGNTWADYVQMLDANASYLGQLGEDVTNVSQLWQFAIMQAAGLSPLPVLDAETDISVPSAGDLLDFSRQAANSLVARNTFGPLGYGWTDNWEYSLAVGSDGTVTVTMPSGQERIFQPDTRYQDQYFSEPGDDGVLTELPGGGYLLTEANGSEEFFNANGTLGYVQDANGNRLTAGYTGSGSSPA